MPPAGIVPSLDELEDGDARLGLRPQAVALEERAFKGGEEALAHRIIIALADRCHGGPHAGESLRTHQPGDALAAHTAPIRHQFGMAARGAVGLIFVSLSEATST